MECKIDELSATPVRLNVMYVHMLCVCMRERARVHDSLMVGVQRAGAPHAN